MSPPEPTSRRYAESLLPATRRPKRRFSIPTKVLRDDAGVSARVGQAALLEAGERAFQLPERTGVLPHRDGAGVPDA